MRIRILYDEKGIMAVVKPPGMPAQPDKTGDKDLLTALEEETGHKVHLAHRLDRPVGGVLLLTKTPRAEAAVAKAMAAGQLQKTYLAVLCGVPQEKEGLWEDYLWKNGRTNLSEVVSKDKKGAKLARLSYEVLGEKEGLSLVRIHLMTGRHHQIRVQTSSRGLPIWGDRKYHPSPKTAQGGQIALWSCGMEGKLEKNWSLCVKAFPEEDPFTRFMEILEKM
ncbi:RNA pseudouridine synthase [Anaerotignum lactatifermentans]|uniref:RNA pseudouridylate synthase n=1 Tax=Anaerotignum lactatifermentans TaxID=160404 RepID=A0ABS2G8Z5_9FIRM|nr:RNA pseudouridine synthase [Anaerotignum lactatifermentans]MBM6828375.1 RNA pseudouridine synthase [Anaerotignum lactatifermentans]MBM6877655.1 RNA pseudouridine synthase [Anaerotignum lactatifermentans]MBM6949958.1 RNA pseudouridine synthase [Anaerotignum lactatifermentans]